MTGFQLIVDSGATKTEWRVLGGNEGESIFSSGISPYLMNKEQIVADCMRHINERTITSIRRKKLARKGSTYAVG